MSLLPRSQIVSRLRSGNLVISPVLSDRQIGSCSVDLRMGTVALMVRARGLSHVHPSHYTEQDAGLEERNKRQKLERHEIPFHQPFLLHPGMLTLVPTYEWIALPNDLQAVVTARSCWAREGLNIATATFIGPGYRGIVTLELSNLGQIPIALYPGLRVAQIALTKIASGYQRTPKSSQFHMAFEPQAGRIADGDEAFIDGSKRTALGAETTASTGSVGNHRGTARR